MRCVATDIDRWPQLIFLVSAAGSLAQNRPSVADSSHFRPLELAGPNEYRSGAGRPGPKYWQQRVDYRIRATLDPDKNEIRGSESIHYVNHSPDSLLLPSWLYVEQNICEPNSVTGNACAQSAAARSFSELAFDFSCQGLQQRAETGVAEGRGQGSAANAVRYHATSGSRQASRLAQERRWIWTLNGISTFPRKAPGAWDMTGSLYEIAQWYPRMAVYDDVKGWNHEPYIGAGEFYLEYGNFDVSLTVPFGHIVAATGELANPEQVLTAAQRQRLALARKSDTTVAIIRANEAGKVELTRPTAVGAKPATLTWHYTATNVRDFAFAAGPEFRWDASGYSGILIEALYRLKADKWAEVNRMGHEAIKYYSDQWFKYPYSHATTIEGPVEGMEYPMLTFTPNSPTREDQQWVIAHEFGHEWFPMVVGSNERLYPWMDEGFNTFIDLANAAKYFAGTPYGDTIEVHPLHLNAEHAVAGNEQPLITKPVEVRDLFWGGYQEAGAHDADAPLRGARQGALRRSLPRLHPYVGIQASHASRFLPHHARQLGHGARLVLARLGLRHGSPRPGGRLGLTRQ